MKKKGFEITGVKDVQKILNEVAPKHARNLMRTTIHGVATEITNDAKKRVAPISKTVSKALKSKRKKSPPDRPVSEVIVQTGRNAKHDGFFWHWIEYGTKERTVKSTGVNVGAMPETPFIRPAADAARANFQTIFTEQFGKKLEQKLAREAKKRAKKK